MDDRVEPGELPGPLPERAHPDTRVKVTMQYPVAVLLALALIVTVLLRNTELPTTGPV